MAEVISNVRAGGDVDLLPVPLRADGTPFRFEAVFGQTRAYADTADSLLDALIEGYADTEEPAERLAKRIGFAVACQEIVQGWLNTENDLRECSNWERAILDAPRDVPVRVNAWECPVPLVLVDVFYAPRGPLPRPTGEGDVRRPRNLVWIFPEDPYELVESLSDVGVLTLHEAIEAVA